MRRLGLMLVATLAGASLAGCSKSGGDQATGSEGQATPPASAPAAELTDAQKQKLVADLPAPYNTGDIAHGKTVFMICKSCHTTASGGANMTGPNLYGVFGRKAGSSAGFTYSDGLKASGITWDAVHLDSWVTSPKAVVADTKMSFVGLKDPKDRADLIAYLKTEVSPAP